MHKIDVQMLGHRVIVEAERDDHTDSHCVIAVASWINGWPFGRYEMDFTDLRGEANEQTECEFEYSIIADHLLNNRLTRRTWTDRNGGTHFWQIGEKPQPTTQV